MPAEAQPQVSARMLVIDAGRHLLDAVSTSYVAHTLLHVRGGQAGAAALQASEFDIVLADLDSLTDLAETTERAVSRLARLGGTALLLVVSAHDSVSAAVEALQAGAHDCLTKPLTGAELTKRIATLKARYARHAGSAPDGRRLLSVRGRFIARAPQMQVILDQLSRIAPSSAPVFLTGEAGTGKRLVAETLHALGPGSERPFIVIDCARIALSEGETQSGSGLARLIGEASAQLLAQAGGGTVLFHEIGALPFSAQAHLFSLVDPDGATLSDTDRFLFPTLRIVCSTHQNPAVLVMEKALRQDLFYRLNVLPIHLPPLRQRPEDIGPLAVHFLAGFSRDHGRHFSGFSPAALAYLDAHDWPGNVRQLETLVERIVSMFDGPLVVPQMLAAADVDDETGETGMILPLVTHENAILPMWQQEQRIIEAAISHFHGNIARAAAALEISPSTIYRKKQAWEDRDDGLAGAA